MASSRLEKIGTIYTRSKGLIKNGAKRWEDRPLWFDIYESFPPKEEPTFSRPAPNLQLRQIFYQEDRIRALFHKKNKYVGIMNLTNTNTKTLTQRFIESYTEIEEKYQESEKDQEAIYNEAIEILRRDKDKDMENIGLSLTDKENMKKSPIKVDVTNLFK
ncbi:28S ribosomal protein S23, mitochondrial [Harmonia axyridis]|uniref:28S ribosomal protein S23, mitochondrial n=1 Tax=Harmonia axyridis TaxID=115357 RepID=UPI001E27587D|nr:28S ribosomal protein S23, mitochondrial [Harmonia axyridis]